MKSMTNLHPLSPFRARPNSKGLVTNYGEGGYKTGGGAREVLPLQKVGAEKVLAMLKWGAQQLLG